jgi:hypothetical protein
MQRALAIVLLLPVFLLGTVGPSAADEGPSVKDVHAAIARGADWLREAHAQGFKTRTWHDPVELVVLTLSHAGVPLSDPVMAKGIETIEKTPLQFTYRVSVLAMALERLNAKKYRKRIAHCAQWLVDTQLAGGEWGYPGSLQGPTRQPRSITVDDPTGEAEEDDTAGRRKPIVIERKIDVETYGKTRGDFSNTQFAVLGLRACRDAGIRIPKETWKGALAYMTKYQREDGGWGYVYFGEQDEASYGSLTCAGLCGAAVCLHALKKSPTNNIVVKKAKAWLDAKFDPARNPGIDSSSIIGPSTWINYNLYSVERVGSVLKWKEIGGRAWYPVGARHLLATQRSDGSWVDPGPHGPGPRPLYLTTADTCFAILFLARATPPLTGR